MGKRRVDADANDVIVWGNIRVDGRAKRKPQTGFPDTMGITFDTGGDDARSRRLALIAELLTMPFEKLVARWRAGVLRRRR
jgi:hypothetical protein